MNMKEIKFYIGANNTTGEVEIKKITKYLTRYYQGFNVQDILGYWQGKPEKSVLVSILTENVNTSLVGRIAKHLTKILNQDAIITDIVDSNAKFINNSK